MKIKLQAPMSCSGSFEFRVLSLEFKVLGFRGLGFWAFFGVGSSGFWV